MATFSAIYRLSNIFAKDSRILRINEDVKWGKITTLAPIQSKSFKITLFIKKTVLTVHKRAHTKKNQIIVIIRKTCQSVVYGLLGYEILCTTRFTRNCTFKLKLEIRLFHIVLFPPFRVQIR